MPGGDDSDRIGRILPFLIPADFPPPSATVQVEFGACSRQGVGHPINDDHYLIVRLGRNQQTLRTSLPANTIPDRFDEYGYGMVVADGVDSGRPNEAASRLAITTLVHLVLYFGKWNLRIDDQIAQEVMERAERFYRHVDVALTQQGRQGPDTRLQTTMTATFGAGHDLFFAHVGHSRAYLLRDGQLLRLTHDHTIGRGGRTRTSVAPLVDVNAAARDLKHIITDTIGMGGAVGPMIDIERFQLDDGDVVLVCTNGLTDMVEEDVIAEVLTSSRSPDDQSRTLVNLAIDGGGEDDATALVARYHIPD